MKKMSTDGKTRVLIIGIDSATFDVIDPMRRAGKLPNLSSLINNGTSGKLRSTIPPVTPPAWVSFMTGKNPGKHGVFDFYVPPSYGYERPVWNSNYIKAKTIWKTLSESGRSVGLINMPMTHPPEKINGFVIPGVQYSVSGDESFSHPPELMREIAEHAGDYQVLYGDMESLYTNDLDALLEKWSKIFEVRKKAILYLMEKKKWDVFTAVFYSIDVMQHHFWKFFDASHPQHDPHLARKYGEVIPDFYERIDSAIGEMLDRIDDDTVVLVVSDHGAGAERQAFSLNAWLHREGFLRFKPVISPLWKFRFPHLVYKVLRRLKFQGVSWTVPLSKLKTLGRAVDPREGLNIPHFIDWERTRAYAGNHTEQGIYINLAGREPGGIVKKGQEYDAVRELLIARLREIQDPETGRPVNIEIYKKEDVYKGPHIDGAPDLFCIMKGGSCLMQKEMYQRELFHQPNKSSGTHRMDGILILKGRNIRSGCSLENVHIMDLAPTILHILGLPVPEDMDGKAVVGVFDNEFISAHPVKFRAADGRNACEGDGVLDARASEEMKKSLRDLGYFG
jgi:predicted AlkP superfamily phosphohydrolase/phosphomutase